MFSTVRGWKLDQFVKAGWALVIAMSPLSLSVDQTKLTYAVILWGCLGIAVLSLKRRAFRELKPMQSFGIAMLWPLALVADAFKTGTLPQQSIRPGQPPTSGIEVEKASNQLSGTGYALLLLGLLAVAIALGLRTQPMHVDEPTFAPAGVLLDIQPLSEGAFGGAASAVKTDAGMYQVDGAVSTAYGQKLFVRSYPSDSAFNSERPALCLADRVTCFTLRR